MTMTPLVLILLTFSLSGCALNQGFPKDIKGELHPLNSQKVIKDVESANNT
ncbi:MAG: hypothetical protein ACRYGR_10545 [Janthinobacterium lividum]